VLVIHEDAAASYPFLQVASGDALPAFVLAPLKPSSLQLSGWLRHDVAGELLTAAGLELETLKRRARDPAFRAFAIPDATLSASGELVATEVTSHNVIARLRGASRPDEYVLYGAHWDANGRNGPTRAATPCATARSTNATGTAEVLEIARAFVRGPRPGRTVLFAAWTAEEKGLLGAEHYATNPVYPLARTAAVINLDPHVVLRPRGRRADRRRSHGPRAAAGRGRGEPRPARHAGAQPRGRLVLPLRSLPVRGAGRAGDRLPRRTRPRRGWHGGRQRDRRAVQREDYHQTTDEFDPRWTFAGTVQEATVAFELGRSIANDGSWPGWYPGVEYGAVRAASEPERAPAAAK